MTPRNETRTDNKLLLGVAAVVVIGAIGIAVVAGLATRDDGNAASTPDRAKSPARVSAPAVAREAKTPASPVSFPAPVQEAVAAPEAIALVTPAFEIDPDADVWREGNRAYQNRRYAEAVAYFAADAQARPGRAYTHYMHGLSLWKSGDLDSAVAAMERSAERNEASIRTWVNLSRIRNERGEHEASLDAAEMALSLDAESVTALYQKARSLYNLMRVDEAVVSLEACIALDAAAGQAHNLLGLIHLRRGDDIAALSAFEVAAALEPDVAYVQNNLGLALERNERLTEAVTAFRRAAELDPDHEAAAVSLARVESRLPGVPEERDTELVRLAAVTDPAPAAEAEADGPSEASGTDTKAEEGE